MRETDKQRARDTDLQQRTVYSFIPREQNKTDVIWTSEIMHLLHVERAVKSAPRVQDPEGVSITFCEKTPLSPFDSVATM